LSQSGGFGKYYCRHGTNWGIQPRVDPIIYINITSKAKLGRFRLFIRLFILTTRAFINDFTHAYAIQVYIHVPAEANNCSRRLKLFSVVSILISSPCTRSFPTDKDFDQESPRTSMTIITAVSYPTSDPKIGDAVNRNIGCFLLELFERDDNKGYGEPKTEIKELTMENKELQTENKEVAKIFNGRYETALYDSAVKCEY
jgi:hypothetical protein